MFFHLRMADKKLVSYVKKQVAAGYGVDSIRRSLIKYGYQPVYIDEAIKAARKRFPWMFVIIFIIVLIGVIAAVLIIKEAPEEKVEPDFELKTATSTTNIKAGRNIFFNVDLVNTGGVGSYNFRLNHQILDSNGKIIASQQESLLISTRAESRRSQIRIPIDAETGSYRLRTTASYDTEVIESVFTFDVESVSPEEIEVIELKCPESCDDNDECTDDFCSAETGYECRHDMMEDCCGNGVCESGEDYTNCAADCEAVVVEIPETTVEDSKYVRDTIKGIKNPSDANKFCSGLAKEKNRDLCYQLLAENTNTSSYCEKIISDSVRDECYTSFALIGDYSVCDKIINKWLKESCVALSQLEIPEEYT